MDLIEIDIKEIEWQGVVWVRLAECKYKWLAVVNTVMNIRVP
jgi:hypothetical protein